MSEAVAPQPADVYDEIHEKAVKKFVMDENVCYQGTKSFPKDSTGINEAKGPNNKKIFIILFVLVLALLLGTICACVVFALEISDLKSEIASLQTSPARPSRVTALETNFENLTQQVSISQQQSYALERNVENLTQQVKVISLQQSHALETNVENLTVQNNMILTQQINMLSQQQSYALETNVNNLTQQINMIAQQQSHALENFTEQVNMVSQHLTTSTGSFQQQIDRLTPLTNTTHQLNMSLQDLYSFIQLPANCFALPPSSPSGYYWLRGNRQAQRVYCDFNRTCGCEGPSTWTHVAFLNTTDPNEDCPRSWVRYTGSRTSCGNGGLFSTPGCRSATYSTFGLNYSRVCGRIIALQLSDTAAFDPLVRFGATIEGNYLDGISITHGSPGSRQHIWSFASAPGDSLVDTQPYSSCSCSSSNSWPYSTRFVGNDYFCDTGYHRSGTTPLNAIFSDPLWDGAGCGGSSTCCSFNNPPWFCKTLPQPTTDDLEVRNCDSGRERRDTLVQLLEIYVQ